MEYIVWPFVAHPEVDRGENYEWNVSVLSGPQAEQRISFRDIPVFTSTATYELFPNQLASAKLLAEAAFRSNNRLLLPLWSERVFPSTVLNGTILQIFGDFRFSKFDSPGRAIAWVSPNEYYVLDVINQLPDRIVIADFDFPDLTGKSVVLMPLLEGRADGDISFGLSSSFRHRGSFDFRASVERNYRYKLNFCIALDASNSMSTNNRWETQKAALTKLVDYIATFIESSLVDVSLRFVFCGASVINAREYQNLRDADILEDLKAWVNSAPQGVVFSFSQAATQIVNFYADNRVGTNIGIIMTDADDLNEPTTVIVEGILADLLNTTTSPHSILEGNSVSLYAIGIDSSNATLTRFNRLSNTGPAIRLEGNALDQYNQVLRDILFGEDTPLIMYPYMFDTHLGLPVLSRKFLKEDSVNDVITRARTGFLTPSGMDWYTDQRIINENTYMLNFDLMGPAELQAFLIWTHSIRGKKKAFWLPTQNQDFVLAADQAELNKMVIRRAGMDNPYRLLEVDLQIETVRGEFIYCKFYDAALDELNTNVMVMTLDQNMPRLLRRRDILGIHVMRKFRFDTDLIAVTHDNMLQHRISVASKRVAEPFVPPTIPAPAPE